MLSRSQLAHIRDHIKTVKAKRVLVQLPEGLKTKAQDIVRQVENLGVEAALWVEPCFGACDIPDAQAKRLGTDLIIHIGHAPMNPKPLAHVVYVEFRSEDDPTPALIDHVHVLKDFKRLGVLTTIQHIGFVDKVKGVLEDAGHEIKIGKSKRAVYEGQLLGCDQSAATAVQDKVDAFLFFGTGRFHPLGVLRKTKKPVFVLDMEKKKIEKLVDDSDYEKKCVLKKLRFDEAKKVGLIASTKLGQLDPSAFKIKNEIEALGKDVTLIVADFVSEDKILGLKLDVLVNTACPRLEEDYVFKTPLVNWSTVKRLKRTMTC